MTRPILLFLLLFSVVQCVAQSYSLGTDEYKHQINFSDHRLVFQLQSSGLNLKATNFDKTYHWYSNNQLKTTQGSYSGKLLHGLYNDFYFNNSLKEQGQFEMGLKVGEWRKWTLQGLLTERINFNKGILNGPFYKYDALGKLLEKGYYKNGKIEGKLTRYFAQDSISIVRYKKGVVKVPRNNWLKGWLKKLIK